MSLFIAARNAAGTGGLILLGVGVVFAGYVLVKSVPDIRRYIKISTM